MTTPQKKKSGIAETWLVGIYFTILGGFGFFGSLLALLGSDRGDLSLGALAAFISFFSLWLGLSFLFLHDYLNRLGYKVSLSLAMKRLESAWKAPVFPPRIKVSKEIGEQANRGVITTSQHLDYILAKEQ